MISDISQSQEEQAVCLSYQAKQKSLTIVSPNSMAFRGVSTKKSQGFRSKPAFADAKSPLSPSFRRDLWPGTQLPQAVPVVSLHQIALRWEDPGEKKAMGHSTRSKPSHWTKFNKKSQQLKRRMTVQGKLTNKLLRNKMNNMGFQWFSHLFPAFSIRPFASSSRRCSPYHQRAGSAATWRPPRLGCKSFAAVLDWRNLKENTFFPRVLQKQHTFFWWNQYLLLIKPTLFVSALRKTP